MKMTTLKTTSSLGNESEKNLCIRKSNLLSDTPWGPLAERRRGRWVQSLSGHVTSTVPNYTIATCERAFNNTAAYWIYLIRPTGGPPYRGGGFKRIRYLSVRLSVFLFVCRRQWGLTWIPCNASAFSFLLWPSSHTNLLSQFLLVFGVRDVSTKFEVSTSSRRRGTYEWTDRYGWCARLNAAS